MSECPVCLGVPGYEVHMCGKVGLDMPEPRVDADTWNRAASAEQQLREIDSLREMAKEANDIAALMAENANLKTVMIAAAEELATHWGAHCDADGYGPQNLLHRLEGGIPSEYGYTAGAFTTLTSDFAAARAELAGLVSLIKEYEFDAIPTGVRLWIERHDISNKAPK